MQDVREVQLGDVFRLACADLRGERVHQEHGQSGGKPMIRPCTATDFETIYAIINDAARAYKGVIPVDRWHEPYMPKTELRAAINSDVQFWGFEQDGALVGVMGVQPVQDVTLIRHAYVRTSHRRHGIGSELLQFLLARISTPTLIGTWANADWAIRFYEKHGFRLVPPVGLSALPSGHAPIYWSAMGNVPPMGSRPNLAYTTRRRVSVNLRTDCQDPLRER